MMATLNTSSVMVNASRMICGALDFLLFIAFVVHKVSFALLVVVRA